MGSAYRIWPDPLFRRVRRRVLYLDRLSRASCGRGGGLAVGRAIKTEIAARFLWSEKTSGNQTGGVVLAAGGGTLADFVRTCIFELML